MSKAADINLWGIHVGKTGDAESLLLKKNCIAAGWAKMDRSGCEKAAIKYTIYVNRQVLTVSPVADVEVPKSYRK
jgi:hypothetical protein